MRSVDVTVMDTTLRDGSHAMAHRYTEQQVEQIVRQLDAAGIPVIEVSHGDGLGGSSFNYGFSEVDEFALIRRAVQNSQRATIACLLLPGIGTRRHIAQAADAGAGMVRIATHCTEADISPQHFSLTRELGLDAVGFLMMSHMLEPAKLAKQARIMVDAGATGVYVVDSAGALILQDVETRIAALVDEIGSEAKVGFHGHQNLTLAVANSVIAIHAGATLIDGTTRGLGAGAGNTQTEVLVAVLDRLDIDSGVDLDGIVHASEVVSALCGPHEPKLDSASLILGYAGVYSSFLLHSQRAAERYGVAAKDILLEVGRRHYVGGQEDLILDVALSLSETRKPSAS
jgi:4-hydroxy 2-oxovalerate aldolase